MCFLPVQCQFRAIWRVSRGGGQLPPQFRDTPQKFSGQSSFWCVSQRNISAHITGNACGNLLHNFVEPDESTKVHQLSMINQTLGTWASENFTQGLYTRIFQVKPRSFVGWAKMVKFLFFTWNKVNSHFCWKYNKKMSNFKMQGGAYTKSPSATEA